MGEILRTHSKRLYQQKSTCVNYKYKEILKLVKAQIKEANT